jgi:cysteinyl-tRNA synthetase
VREVAPFTAFRSRALERRLGRVLLAVTLDRVSIRLYDTATRTVRDFVPVREGSVGIYHCGLTVQAAPHIGHIRKEVAFDVLRRWFDHRGYEVTLIANVTDIDDKILLKSGELQQQWWALAYANERLLHQAYDLLGCLPPSYEPRATGHIPEMLEMIDTLVDKGHAYVAEDGSGDVYFDVRSWPTYGELSNQRIEDMEAATDADPRGKRDPRDFALWKGHKAGEPHTASWATPWGRGRPGWHLECSAMVGKYLGSEFDIHGGGLDLRFPHHENEMAQSRAAGHGFARYWMHNALVTTAGEKMSKSLGNSALVSEVVKHVRPIELRYYLVAAHYRSVIEFSFESLAEAGAAFKRIEGYVLRASELAGAGEPATDMPEQFSRAMDEDLGCRRRWLSCRAPSGRPTSSSVTCRRRHATSPPCGGCWPCSGSTRLPGSGRPPPTTLGFVRLSTRSSPPSCSDGRRPERRATSPPPTPSANSCKAPASRSRTRPTVHAGTCPAPKRPFHATPRDDPRRREQTTHHGRQQQAPRRHQEVRQGQSHRRLGRARQARPGGARTDAPG